MSPKGALLHGDQFPYDAPDAWWANKSKSAPPAADWAQRAARGVLTELTQQPLVLKSLELGRDVRRAPENIRAEVVQTIAEIILQACRERQ